LPVVAIQAVRKMRGGAQSHLMLGADGHPYVVKFQNNPQHVRVLANELLGTRLAALAGLSVPPCDVIEVSEWLIQNSADLVVDFGQRREPCRAGLQFGSRLVGGLMPGQVMDYLPEPQLTEVKNLREFAGMLVIDKWTCNANGRQAVFLRRPREKQYTATFIDQGYCFNAGEWKFADAPLRGVYARNLVYRDVVNWESFEPWLTRVEEMDPQRVWAVAETVPPEWYGSDVTEIERLMEQLLARRKRVRELITQFRESSRGPFPNWMKTQKFVMDGQFTGPSWADEVRGPVM
jgi:hypothetical protein